MPLSITYIEDGGIIVRGEGLLTGSEIKEVNDIIYESPEKIERLLYQLVDFTDVSDISISNAEVEKLAIQDIRAFKVDKLVKSLFTCHCEEPSDEAIS